MTIVNGLNGTIKLAIEELQAGSALFGTAAGTDTYTLTISNITAYPRFLFVLFTNANTTTSTINLNGIGAVTLKKSVSTNLAGGDIAAGSMHILGYDGTNYQVLTLGGGGTGGTGDVVGPASATSGAVVLYDGTTGKLIKNSTILPTTVGIAIANLTNPSAITFIRINADNSVTARSASDFRTDLSIVNGHTIKDKGGSAQTARTNLLFEDNKLTDDSGGDATRVHTSTKTKLAFITSNYLNTR